MTKAIAHTKVSMWKLKRHATSNWKTFQFLIKNVHSETFFHDFFFLTLPWKWSTICLGPFFLEFMNEKTTSFSKLTFNLKLQWLNDPLYFLKRFEFLIRISNYYLQQNWITLDLSTAVSYSDIIFLCNFILYGLLYVC